MLGDARGAGSQHAKLREFHCHGWRSGESALHDACSAAASFARDGPDDGFDILVERNEEPEKTFN
jgi:hypothetical protein